MLSDGLGSQILGGWLVSGIFSARTGRPFTVTQSNNNVGTGATGVPDLTGDPEGPKTVEQWFNIAAYTRVASGEFGNSPRNDVRGPGWVTFDLSVQRRIDLTSRLNATLRWDIFNVFNRANLGLPDRNIASATAGVISTLAGDPRVMQLSVRVAFWTHGAKAREAHAGGARSGVRVRARCDARSATSEVGSATG